MHAETDPLKIYETFRKDELDKADAVRKHGLRMELREIIEYIAEQPDGDWLGADDARLILDMMDERDAALRARVEALEAALRERDGGDHDRECRIWMSNWQKREDRYCNCGHVEARALLEKEL